MKIITVAFALAIASPALAQTAPAAPAANPHAQHQMGQPQAGAQPGADHSQHQGMQHGQHQGMQRGQQQGQGQQAGCCADRDGDGRMDCCQNMAQSAERRNCCPQQAPQPGARPQPSQNR